MMYCCQFMASHLAFEMNLVQEGAEMESGYGGATFDFIIRLYLRPLKSR